MLPIGSAKKTPRHRVKLMQVAGSKSSRFHHESFRARPLAGLSGFVVAAVFDLVRRDVRDGLNREAREVAGTDLQQLPRHWTTAAVDDAQIRGVGGQRAVREELGDEHGRNFRAVEMNLTMEVELHGVGRVRQRRQSQSLSAPARENAASTHHDARTCLPNMDQCSSIMPAGWDRPARGRGHDCDDESGRGHALSRAARRKRVRERPSTNG